MKSPKRAETTVYPVVDNAEGIAYFANFGVITFHVPSVLITDEDHPDWVIWDLDPPPDRVDLVREAAVALRSILDDHGIPTVPPRLRVEGLSPSVPVEAEPRRRGRGRDRQGDRRRGVGCTSRLDDCRLPQG